MAIPLTSSSFKSSSSLLNLLQSSILKQPISKTRCLILNSHLINRDGALFDSLPWDRWTVGNQTLDASGNPILPKYHLGKRDAYNRFMGKDWPGRSLSIPNLAQRVLYEMESDGGNDNYVFDEDAILVLAKRVLELERKEKREELASLEQQFAIARTSNADTALLQEQIVDCNSTLETIEQSLLDLNNNNNNNNNNDNLLQTIIDLSASSTNSPPYRGAIGFAPKLDSREDVLNNNSPYTGPYDLLHEIIREQLNANIIGTVLEDTWILDERTLLGGACVLQRKREKTTVNIGDEEVELYEDDTQNKTVKGGDVFTVECDADEIIGLALATGVHIQVTRQLWEDMNVMVMAQLVNLEETTFPTITVVETERILIQPVEKSDSNDPSATSFSLPKTTSAFFSPPNNNNNPLFPKDNPVQALSQLDTMTNVEKAKALLSLEKSGTKLPRPRTLRESPNILTERLLPLIDESVRRQYEIREALQKGDLDTAQSLEKDKSRRLRAREMAESAEEETDVQGWNDAADFYGTLRADVTQDEGSYSSYLDKDDWYEKDRLRIAKNAKKSDFGTLLDGIE